MESISNEFDVAILGGGASGFFSAICIKEANPNLSVCILEKTGKVLQKVKVSGGGRCNVTHTPIDNSLLIQNYPRGKKELMSVFSNFNSEDVINWFQKHGVKLKTEKDGRMFPESNSSDTIINLFRRLVLKYDIQVFINCNSIKIEKVEEQNIFQLESVNGATINTKKIIVCIGGSYQSSHYDILKKQNISITALYPSLFTLICMDEQLRALTGLSVEKAEIKLEGEKNGYEGAILITHWGFSGPVILKCSAFSAIDMANKNYQFNLLVNWVLDKLETVLQQITDYKSKNPRKIIGSNNPFSTIPNRLYQYFMAKSGINETKPWSEISKKEMNKLSEILTRDVYHIEGKNTFKDEFVTAGGVNLNKVDMKTMQSKEINGIYFAGEILNIDGVTGGFNFQSAWSTAFIASKGVVDSLT